jgi:signal transduction histidine kinase
MAALPDKSLLMLRTMRDLTGLAALATDWVDDRPIPVAKGSAEVLLRTRRLDLTDQTTQQVRNLWLDLRPTMLDDLGLVAAVRWYADRQSQQAGFAVAYSRPAEHPTEGSQS